MINLADKTGRHIIDPGPTFNIHSPIFWEPKVKGQSDSEKALKDLEFGQELQFFRAHQARDAGTREVEERSCRVLEIKNGALEVTLLDAKSGKPFQVTEARNGQTVSSIRYLSYETDLPFQKSLFEPPKGITMQEAR